MLIRKINAGLSLLTALLFFDHAIFYTVWMMSGGTIEEHGTFMPRLLFVLVLIHGLISIGLVISTRSKTETQKGRAYPKLNASTIVQRISGFALIIFAGLHAAEAVGSITPPPIVTVMFFVIVLTHVAISTSKAFITLGIGNAKFVKVADLVIKVICAATLIAALAGVYLYKV